MKKPGAFLVAAKDPNSPPGKQELVELEASLRNLRPGDVVTTPGAVELFQLINGYWYRV